MSLSPTLAAMIAICIFSFGTLFNVLALEVPMYQFLAMKFTIGGLSIMIFDKLRGRDVLKDWKQPIKSYLLVGTAFGVYNFMLLKAFHHTPAFEVNVLNYLWPILIAVFAAIIGGEKLGLAGIASVLLGFCGMVFVFLPQDGAALFADITIGHFLAIGGAVIWAFYSVTSRSHDYPAGFLAPVILIVAACFAVLHLIYEDFYIPPFLILSIIIIFGLTRFCYVLWDYAIRTGDRVSLSALSYLTPLFSTLLFLTFDLKPASPYVALGGALIIGGCLVVSIPRLITMLKARQA